MNDTIFETTHDEMVNEWQIYLKEIEKFNVGNNTAGTRARKALMNIIKLSKIRRAEIIDIRNDNKV